MPKFRRTTVKTVVADLRALADWLEKDENTVTKRQIVPHVNNIYDSLLGEDAFGTEGQCDPRGDHRD